MPNDPPANKQHSVPFKKKVIYQQYQMINNTEELQRSLPTMEGGSGPSKNKDAPKKKKQKKYWRQEYNKTFQRPENKTDRINKNVENFEKKKYILLT